MPRVLIIEDDDDLRRMLHVLLRTAGYQVGEARNGREGMVAMDREPASLIITDLIMPEQEGIETILSLRRRRVPVRIIAISGGGRLPGSGYLELAKRAGADRVLQKPVQNDQLLQSVADLLADS